MTIVILAAGMGQRFGGLKQMEDIDGLGHTLLDYSLTDAVMAGFDRAVFIIRKEMKDAFLSLISTRRWYESIPVDFVLQELDSLPFAELPRGRKKPFGTAHAIACLGERVKTPFAIINADDFYGREAFFELAEGLKNDEERMVAYRLKNTLSQNGSVSRGVCKTEGDFLKEIEEKGGIKREGEIILDREGNILPENSPVSMNLWVFKPHIIEECRRAFPLFIKENIHKSPESCELFLPSVVSDLIRKKDLKIRVKSTSSTWLGITYREDKFALTDSLKSMMQKGIYPTRL